LVAILTNQQTEELIKAVDGLSEEAYMVAATRWLSRNLTDEQWRACVHALLQV
jgi:hypothetical protein